MAAATSFAADKLNELLDLLYTHTQQLLCMMSEIKAARDDERQNELFGMSGESGADTYQYALKQRYIRTECKYAACPLW